MYEFLGCFNVLRPNNTHVWIVYVKGFGNSEMSVNWLGFMFYHVSKDMPFSLVHCMNSAWRRKLFVISRI